MTLPGLLILAQGGAAPGPAPAPQGARSADPMLWLLPILLVVVFYFFMLRPQKKREQQRKQMIEQLQRGDRVVTIGGIHGEVLSIKEQHVILLVDPERRATLKVNRSAIHRVDVKDASA